MERIENPMVVFKECDSEEKSLEICQSCYCELFHGDTVYKVNGMFFCKDCVEKIELDSDDDMPEEPDYDYYRDLDMESEW